RLGRVLGLEAAEPDADDTPIAVALAPFDRRPRLLLREAARDVRGQADVDAVLLPRLLDAAAHALEDLLPRRAAPDALRGTEDPLEVDGPVPGRLGRVVDDHLPVVGLGLQRVRRQDPHLDEVPEVGEPVELLEPLDAVGRQRVVVASRDLEQRLRANRALEMHVELDLGIGRHAPHATRLRCNRVAVSTLTSWARPRTGCGRSAARCWATGSPSASAAAPADA